MFSVLSSNYRNGTNNSTLFSRNKILFEIFFNELKKKTCFYLSRTTGKTFHRIVTYHLPTFKVPHQKIRYNWDIFDQMKKEICFNKNSAYLDYIAYASYLFNVGLRYIHFTLFSSDRNETKVLRFLFWLNIFGKIYIQIKNRKLLQIEISILAT